MTLVGRASLALLLGVLMHQAASLEAWTRVFKCAGDQVNGLDRLDYKAATILALAQNATRVRICANGNATDCSTSVAGSFPIVMLRQGRIISHNGNSVCNTACVAATWTGTRNSNLWSGAVFPGPGTNVLYPGSQSNLYHASNNQNGLHMNLTDGGYCGWTAARPSLGKIEVFLDVPPPPIAEPYQYASGDLIYHLVALTNGQRKYGKGATPVDWYFPPADPAVGEYVKPLPGTYTRLRYECGYRVAGVLGYIELNGTWEWTVGGLLANASTIMKVGTNITSDPQLPGYAGDADFAWSNARANYSYPNMGVEGFSQVDGKFLTQAVWTCHPHGPTSNWSTWSPSPTPNDVPFVRLWLAAPAPSPHYWFVDPSSGVNWTLVAVTNGAAENPPANQIANSSDPAVGEYVKPLYGTFRRLRYECGYRAGGVVGFVELAGNWTWTLGSVLTANGTASLVASNALWVPSLPGYLGDGDESWTNAKINVRPQNFGMGGFLNVDGRQSVVSNIRATAFACDPQVQSGGIMLATSSSAAYLVKVTPGAQATRANSSYTIFNLVPGLADAAAKSLQVATSPSYYLRDDGGLLMAEPGDGTAQFNASATWWLRQSLDGLGGVSFQSFGTATKYFRLAANDKLTVTAVVAGTSDYADASFSIRYSATAGSTGNAWAPASTPGDVKFVRLWLSMDVNPTTTTTSSTSTTSTATTSTPTQTSTVTGDVNPTTSTTTSSTSTTSTATTSTPTQTSTVIGDVNPTTATTTSSTSTTSTATTSTPTQTSMVTGTTTGTSTTTSSATVSATTTETSTATTTETGSTTSSATFSATVTSSTDTSTATATETGTTSSIVTLSATVTSSAETSTAPATDIDVTSTTATVSTTRTSTTSATATRSATTTTPTSTQTGTTTGTTTTTTSSTNTIADLDEEVVRLLKRLQTSGASDMLSYSSSEADITVLSAAAATKLPGGYLGFSVGGEGGVRLALPPSLGQSLDDGASVAVVSFSPASNFSEGDGGAPDFGSVESVAVSIRVWKGNFLHVAGLPLSSPVLITWPRNRSWGQDARCAYWDVGAARWSSEGLVEGNSTDDTLVCATTHLTIFAVVGRAIVQQLECINIKDLTADGLERLDGRWPHRAPAVLLWVLLACGTSWVLYGLWADHQVRTSGLWQDAYHITHLPEDRAPIGAAHWALLAASLVGACRAAPRSCCGTRREGRPSLLAALWQWVVMRATVSGVLSVVAVRSGLCMEEVREHVWGPYGFVQLDVARQCSEQLCRKLDSSQASVPAAFRDFFAMGLCARFALLLRAVHPLCGIGRLALTLSAAKRAKLMADALLGALVISALFFAATGSAMSIRSAPDCAQERWHSIRFIFIGLLSSLLVKVPLVLVARLHRRAFVDEEQWGAETARAQLRWWRGMDFLFWFCGLLWTGCCIFFLLAFLSDLNSKDDVKWIIAFLSVIIRMMLVWPFIVAGTVAVAAALLDFLEPSFATHGDPRFGFEPTPAAAHYKVEELAGRSMSVGDLLDFYALLGTKEVMRHFDPDHSTTHDVVRQAIIPLSRRADFPGGGAAYATIVADGKERLAEKMVTHAWGNKFSHLCAAILADCLGHRTYTRCLEQLARGPAGVEELRLRTRAKLHKTYWVCAFCVNQHAGICATAPPRDSTGYPIQTCTCPHEKHTSGDDCEMNKFDDMMEHLRAASPGFMQVIAVDSDFVLFSRIWCVAEILAGFHLRLPQALKIESQECVDEHKGALSAFDVRKAESSVPEDKERILSHIHNTEAFNAQLKDLVLNPLKGLLAMWSAGRMAGAATAMLEDGSNAILQQVAEMIV